MNEFDNMNFENINERFNREIAGQADSLSSNVEGAASQAENITSDINNVAADAVTQADSVASDINNITTDAVTQADSVISDTVHAAADAKQGLYDRLDEHGYFETEQELHSADVQHTYNPQNYNSQGAAPQNYNSQGTNTQNAYNSQGAATQNAYNSQNAYNPQSASPYMAAGAGRYSNETVDNREYQKLREQADKKAEKSESKKSSEKKTKKKKHWFLKGVACMLAALMLGGLAAGGFIGVMHVSGYDDKLSQLQELDAADEPQTLHVSSAVNDDSTAVNSANISNGATDTGVSNVVTKTMPAIVAITSKIIYESNNPFEFFFNNGGSRETTGAGSGIIIGQNDTELLLVTNYHVVENATSLIVTFVDGKEAAATVKGFSEEKDLAVVSVNLDEMEESTHDAICAITFGDSEKLALGDKVIAIGNALGYGQSVTVGYVSALSRDVTINGITRNLLQTDAAINPGNSGGALININGELIGINSAKYSDTQVEGVGYAIPITQVKDLIEELMNKETLKAVDESEASFLGVTPADVDSSSAYLYNMPQGVYVYALTENGPAAKSGILERDIITKIDDNKITSTEDLLQTLKYYPGGKTVDVTVQRIVDNQYQEIVIPVELGLKSDYVKPEDNN